MRQLLLTLPLLITSLSNAQQWNWASDAGGGGNTDFCFGIATDSQGNAYWVGSVSGTADFGCGTLSPGNTIAGFVAKVDPNGVCQWVRSITVGFNEAWTYGIAIDSEDRIYVTGSYDGNADFGNGVSLNSMGSDDIFLARYDVNGTCLWARRAGSSASSDEARGVAVSEDGGVFITGFSGGNPMTFDAITIPNPLLARQVVVARYDSTGTVQWAKASTGTTQNKSARAITVANDRLFITGQAAFTNASFDGIPLLPATNTIGVYALACDLEGNGLWARSYIGGDHEGMGISADTLGNLFVVGRMWGDIQLPDDTLYSVSSNDDMLIMAMDIDGNYRWAKSTGSSQRDVAWGIAADGIGNAYVAAHFNSTIDFFGTSLTSLGSEDILISKMEADGDVVWVQRPSGFQRDIPLCIHRQAISPHELYFGGYFWGSITYGSSTIDDVLNGDAMIVSGIDTTFDVSSIATDVCPGACDGTIEPFITAGTAPFSFQWSEGSTTPELDGLCPGIYIVEVVDANGQTIIDTVYIEELPNPGYLVQVASDSLWTTGGTAWQWFFNGSTLVSDSASVIAEENGDYHALVTDAYGCVWSTDTATVVLNTGAMDRMSNALRIYPVPASSTLFIDHEGPLMNAELFSSAGQRVRTLALRAGRNVLDLAALPSGLYLLRTSDGRAVRVMKE